MYFPYVLATDTLSAFLAALIPHYLQYHGLLYLVNSNKLRAGELGHSPLLARVARSPRAYGSSTLAFGVLLGLLLLLADFGRRRSS